MKKSITLNVEGFGKVYLERTPSAFYSVSDEQGNTLGEFDPTEEEDWDEHDEYVMSNIIADMIDSGELEKPFIDEDEYDEY